MRYRLVSHRVESRALAGNPLHDPFVRPLLLLVPEDSAPDTELPAVWMLPGFSSTGASFLNAQPWQETLLDRLNRLDMAPARFVLPDVFTALGGAQYLDSPAIGAYASYLWEELLPWVEAEYRTGRHGLAGKSSGGFGAIYTALTRPGRFAAVAAHAADMGFEWCYLPDFPKLWAETRRHGGVETFWARFRSARDKPSGWMTAINLIAMAAAYSPDPGRPAPHAAFPVDPMTLELLPEIWERWLAHDPVRLIESPSSQAAARALAYFHFDAGEEDEFNLQYGAERLHRRLAELAIGHHFETFPGGHFRTNHRYDVTLPRMTAALSA